MSEMYGISVILKLIDQLSGPMKQVERSFDRMQTAYRKHGQSMRDVGRNMTMAVSLPLVGLGALATNTAVSFESAFTGVRKTVEATEEQFTELRKGFEGLSLVIPESFENISKIGEAAGQLGIQTENIMGFTEVMAALGVTTNLSADEAATVLARFANITQMSQKDFGRLGSSIVALGNNLATTEAEIADMSLRLAAAGKQVGFTEAQTLGLAGALSSLGLESQAGGTAFSRVLIEMDRAVIKGGKNFQIFSKVSGMSGKQFKDLYKKDVLGAVLAFTDGLGKMGNRSTLVFDALKLDGIRTADALRRVAGSGDQLRNAMALSSDAWEKNIALTREANLRYGTAASQFKMFWNELRLFAKDMGELILPVVLRFLNVARPLLRLLKELPEPVKVLVIAFAGLAAISGPVIWVMGTLIGLFAAMGVAASPVLATFVGIGAALGVIVVGVLALQKAWENLKSGDVFGSTPFGLLYRAVTGERGKSLIPSLSRETVEEKMMGSPLAPAPTLTVPGLMKSATEIVLRIVGDKATAVQSVDKKKGDSKLSVITQGYLGLMGAQ